MAINSFGHQSFNTYCPANIHMTVNGEMVRPYIIYIEVKVRAKEKRLEILSRCYK